MHPLRTAINFLKKEKIQESTTLKHQFAIEDENKSWPPNLNYLFFMTVNIFRNAC